VNVDQLFSAPVITVDRASVIFAGKRVADTAILAADAALISIEPLITALETASRNWSLLHSRQPLPKRVILQADLSVDLRVPRKVTYSAARAGYPDVSFAVNRVARP